MVARFTLCDSHKLQAAVAGELAQAGESELSRHLQSCDHCRHELEVLAGGEKWLDEARQYLSSSDELVAVDDQTSPWQAPAVTPADEPEEIALDFLSPSDDPTKLGRLGAYEIESVIGRGGFGIVLKAFDPGLNRHVAIKALAGTLVRSSAARKRFDREAKAAAAVVHDHVIPIHHIDTSGIAPFLVMPFVTGRSLQERIDAFGPLETKEILRIAMQTAQGLAAAHAQGLVHRDIKPANILLENGVERVRITDFGLARAVDDASQTQSGFIAGTPQYMAPEQARGEPIDARADLFSLGSVMYAMCTGHPPFRAETTLAVLRRICDDEPRSVREINPEVPPWLAAIVERLLAKPPQERFASAEDLAGHLEKWLAHVQQPTMIPPPVAVRGKPCGARPSVRFAPPYFSAAIGAVAFAALAAAWLLGAFQPAKRAPSPGLPPVDAPTILPSAATQPPAEKRTLPVDAVDAELVSVWQETLRLETAASFSMPGGRSIAEEIGELEARLDVLERDLRVPARTSDSPPPVQPEIANP